ncbi:peroxiredoxin family protein [Flectobacillus major]|uniref:peroxiredoxin family protein n=1 Tax=Flectobacillus major TaxID=103 RepID=UPI00040230A8|nr:TlpA disulfide reductase family protein [Flectobacillus major]
MNLKRIYAVAASVLLGFGVNAQTSTPQSGVWRGTFAVFGGQESPFNFELKGKNAYLLNASERFEIKGVTQKGDSLFFPIEIYDAVLAAKIESPTSLSGVLKKANSPVVIPFKAKHGSRYRFFEKPAPAQVNLGGKWEVYMGNSTNPVIGVFEQNGQKVTGTFLSKTGDYRYYEGNVQGNEFYLSAFSGSSPALIKGKIEGDQLVGETISFGGSRPVKATRNEKIELPDAYSLTKIKDGTKFDFTFPDAFTGKNVSLQDDKYKGKVVIVTILGSWCPNCIDEASYLSPWYKANKNRGVEIIGLSFERKNDPAFAKTRLEALKKRFGIEYDILFAGLADTKYASSVLPALSEVMSFPTTIIVDKSGNVAKIHTGYSGPATGKYYDEFVKEFNHDIDELVKANLPTGK